jgi:hypothetical protein
MGLIFIFLDGVGLGDSDPEKNPFARGAMPTLEALLGGQRLVATTAPFVGERATLVALEATLGVPGLPQSATGQAALLTGINIPARVGEHYGPKPNRAVAQLLVERNVFSDLKSAGKSAALLNAYPPRYFHGVDSGRRLYSSIPLAVTSAGIRLFTKDDLFEGKALSADLTGAGWAAMLGFPAAPVLTPEQAGRKLTELADSYDFSFFEYWSTDYAGHKQDMRWASEQLQLLDAVLGGLLRSCRESDLILITSDHGNMEDLSTRRHTEAKVPAILIGPRTACQQFASSLRDLTDVAPAILRYLASTA